MTLAYVSGGSNLDAPRHLNLAARLLVERHPGTRFSRCYRNRAVGFEGPDFINFVAEVPVEGTPAQFKLELQQIEERCGRKRDAPRWAPRQMDLDMLLFGDVVQDEPGLKLPRPDLVHWAFMLGPLAELAPALMHPLQQQSIDALWRAFDRDAHPLHAEPLDLNLV